MQRPLRKYNGIMQFSNSETPENVGFSMYFFFFSFKHFLIFIETPFARRLHFRKINLFRCMDILVGRSRILPKQNTGRSHTLTGRNLQGVHAINLESWLLWIDVAGRFQGPVLAIWFLFLFFSIRTTNNNRTRNNEKFRNKIMSVYHYNIVPTTIK